MRLDKTDKCFGAMTHPILPDETFQQKDLSPLKSPHEVPRRGSDCQEWQKVISWPAFDRLDLLSACRVAATSEPLTGGGGLLDAAPH